MEGREFEGMGEIGRGDRGALQELGKVKGWNEEKLVLLRGF